VERILSYPLLQRYSSNSAALSTRPADITFLATAYEPSPFDTVIEISLSPESGEADGLADGFALGDGLGDGLGDTDGLGVAVGSMLTEGLAVGIALGEDVGWSLGSAVGNVIGSGDWPTGSSRELSVTRDSDVLEEAACERVILSVIPSSLALALTCSSVIGEVPSPSIKCNIIAVTRTPIPRPLR
jgi:hypothetical protein